ncbi:bifunctional protein-serine/threonine kinase/phosphatase [Acinetobacter qingfengensis]|uniref:Protein kinase n=1 Tax=Acinetobacter qingfengensis TaxID=1262585 RepID=A0A1E7RC61_9GAMM|nr:bifunctional protein-serine/threonine kinase/phosphatase [Acinetobacter qingfengensis]OEY96873.1 protein kinase [Acinetobacter qingfengensis]
MPLNIELGQYSDQGKKNSNQDFYGALIPDGNTMLNKGACFAIADGISSSNVSHIASETAISNFLLDYYSTPDSWRVKTSAERVITACNAWLYAQTQQSQGRYDKDRGYVCTFSALVVQADQAHIFHIGDARIYRLQAEQLQQLSRDHRIWLSSQESYLSRALGVGQKVEIDYEQIKIYQDDLFILMTDGVYEFINDNDLKKILLQQHDLNVAAKMIVEHANQQGSQDNLTIQLIRINHITETSTTFIADDMQYTFAPILSIGQEFEGYVIHDVLHHNHRSCVYLASDPATKQQLVIKTPAMDIQKNPILLEQFMLESWIARRLNHPCLMHAYPHHRPKNYLYQTLQYFPGQTLQQWLISQKNHIDPDFIIYLIEQVAKGLNVMHRMEMLHQDIRPENILINNAQQICIIDFGSTVVQGLLVFKPHDHQQLPLGTLAYMAPEYFLNEAATIQSDLYSLAAMTYYLLSRQLPYATDVAKCNSKKQLKQLNYQSILKYRPDLPDWMDLALSKALALNMDQRYDALSEFIYDLKHPNTQLMSKIKRPLIQRNPVLFWQSVSALLFCTLLILLSCR